MSVCERAPDSVRSDRLLHAGAVCGYRDERFNSTMSVSVSLFLFLSFSLCLCVCVSVCLSLSLLRSSRKGGAGIVAGIVAGIAASGGGSEISSGHITTTIIAALIYHSYAALYVSVCLVLLSCRVFRIEAPAGGT